MNFKEVERALQQGGSIRGAAKILNKSYPAVQWWIARNGYEVQRRAVLVKRQIGDITIKGERAIEEEK